jgi:signal transduction histidine kinase
MALVMRSPNDVKIISGPPLLTVGRLSVAVVILLTFLLAAIVWNRVLNGLVNRRSRELIKEQIARTVSQFKIGERTRLAVELHDALSQNLAAVACLVGAARRAVDSGNATASEQLQRAERMLNSCRTELKHCLFDLRSDMLEQPKFADAIRATLNQLHAKTEIIVRFSVPRTRMTDSTAQAILCIIRELASNAISHGKASKIHVAGSIEGETLKFSVRDNGTGFDPMTRPGPREGHFGLDGIRDRVKRIGGDFRLEAAPGKGTYAVITLKTTGGHRERN